ncbi:MAG: helix-turn-helix domain-containing protein [Woeseia sp.]|nr:helix-turn-helix domain-containing protein [Woeseia sp.]
MPKPAISMLPLATLFGSQAACQVLLYLENYNQGYASQIARTFGMSLNQVQNQLKKFEEAGLLVSRNEGSTRNYYFKPGPVADALRAFLGELLKQLPRKEINAYYRERRRPRRPGKR